MGTFYREDRCLKNLSWHASFSFEHTISLEVLVSTFRAAVEFCKRFGNCSPSCTGDISGMAPFLNYHRYSCTQQYTSAGSSVNPSICCLCFFIFYVPFLMSKNFIFCSSFYICFQGASFIWDLQSKYVK